MYEDSTTDRKDFPVLVLDAHERMSIAVIRSLGRAGYPVFACSPYDYAAGFRSSGVAGHAVCPSVKGRGFVPWLRDYCAAQDIRCLVPTEPVLLAIRPVFREFADRLPMSGDERAVFRGINKFDLFEELLADDGDSAVRGLPKMLRIRRANELPAASSLNALGFPVFIKVDGNFSIDGESATYGEPTVAAARDRIHRLLETSDRLIVQGYVPGTGVGAFVLRWNGQILATFMHERLHEIPSRGWSSMSRSWKNERIMEDAIAKLTRLNWQGVAMMEYRWNPEDDSFALIEMNGRFWGSLHLALYAGVDFPVLLLDAFRGAASASSQTMTRDVTCRDAILDLKYTMSKSASPTLGYVDKMRVVFDYVRHALDPRIKSALLFPGDRKLFFWIGWQYVAAALHRRRGDGCPESVAAPDQAGSARNAEMSSKDRKK